MLHSAYAALGVCCTQRMLYSAYAALSVYCTRCMLHSVYAALGVCCTQRMLHSVYAALSLCCTQRMLHLAYAALGVCCTWRMLHLVYAALGVCCTWRMLHLAYAVLGVCCTWHMLHLAYAALGVISWWWHGGRERDDLALCCYNDSRVVDRKERDGWWRWEWYEGYKRTWETRGTTSLIGFKRPHIGVINCRIGIRTCRLRDGKLTHTQNSLKSQFLMMISPISSDLSLSCAQLYHHLGTWS